MSSEQLTQELMSLPLPERVEVAQALWQSIHEGTSTHTDADERDVILEAQRRDAELTSGKVTGRSHEEVLEAARQALSSKCD